MYWHFVFDQLEAVDRVFALKINVRRWLQPLYGDYTFLGHVLGFIFRTIRIIMGVIVHGIMIVFALLVYFTWIILPLILVYGAITGDFLISKYEFIF